MDRGLRLNGEGLVGGFALAGRSKTPEKKEADEAGDDAWRVGDHDVEVLQLHAVQSPRGGCEEGGHRQRE